MTNPDSSKAMLECIDAGFRLYESLATWHTEKTHRFPFNYCEHPRCREASDWISAVEKLEIWPPRTSGN